MSNPARQVSRVFLAAILLVLPYGLPAIRVEASDLLPPGFRPVPLGTHALVGGKVVVKPGDTIDDGTIILRDGLIAAVGKEIAVPADARI